MPDALEVVVDGTTIDVARWPATSVGATRRFLLVHGSPGHLGHFEALARRLQQWGDVAAFDLPGYGRRSTRRPSLGWHADLTAGLARALWPATPIDIVGHSFGGAVALTVVAREPAVVRTAIAIATVGMPAHGSLRTGARIAKLPGAATIAGGVARLFRFGWFGRRAVARFARSSFTPDPMPSDFAADEAALIAKRPWSLPTALRMNLGDPSGELGASLAKISRPILFIHGRDDALVPIAHARNVYDALNPHTHHFVELDGGHMLHYTRPDAVADAIAYWPETVSVSL